MTAHLLARHGRPVPRYTSYPTAPHFSDKVDGETYVGWLRAVPKGSTVSVYVHVPFCAELCLYCGCNTQVVRSAVAVSAYARRLVEEIALAGAHLPDTLSLSHLHFGGGTPSILSADDFDLVMGALRARFHFRDDAEIAIEIDPRVIDREKALLLGRHGFNRASLGVQDFEEDVQAAIGRHQSFEETASAALWLREAGISSINLDLMYGLPHQSAASVARTLRQALELAPSRIAVFGYAHVPWMKKHQALIPEAALPGPQERFAQQQVVEEILADAGYMAVGLDHFALAEDAMAERAASGTLKRNFQGYTTDDAPVLLGFGASAIGALAEGYVQNMASTPQWHAAVEQGRLPVARGVAVTAEDRLRRDVIERLMCDLAVDLDAATARHGFPEGFFAPELERLEPLIADGLAVREGARVVIPAGARAFTRVVCALFDAHLAPAQADEAPKRKRHAAAV